MDCGSVQRLVAALVEHCAAAASEERRERLAAEATRLVAASFSEDSGEDGALELRLARAAGDGAARLFALIASLRARRGVARVDAILAALLRVRELGDRLSTSFFAASAGKRSALSEQPTAQSVFGRGEENGVARGLVWALQAIPSEHFALDRSLDQFLLRPRAELRVGLARQSLLHSLAETGWLFMKVSGAAEAIARRVTTLTAQALLSAVQDEMGSYYAFLAAADTIERTVGITISGITAMVDEQHSRLRYIAAALDAALTLNSVELLSYLYTLSKTGFVSQNEFLGAFLQKAARPFLAFVVSFAETGEVIDPMGEFFVQMNSGGAESRFWSDGARFLAARVPLFFEQRWARLVFSAGRVNRVLMRAGIEPQRVHCALTADDVLGHSAPSCVAAKLERVYALNNGKLMSHVFYAQRLLAVFERQKAILLSGRGDLFAAFIETLQSEVGLAALSSAPRYRLAHCFEAAARACLPSDRLLPALTLAALPSREAEPTRLGEALVGFAPSHSPLPFPLNNVFATDTVRLLQNCFAYIFTLKLQQNDLQRFWRAQARYRGEPRTERLLVGCWHLRMKAMGLFDGLLRHWLLDVVEQRARVLLERLAAAESLDALIADFRAFAETVHAEVTLRGAVERPFAEALAVALQISRQFFETQESVFRTLRANLQFERSFDSLERAESARLREIAELSGSFVAETRGRLLALDRQLNAAVVALIRLGDSRRLANLVDFNDYYLAVACAEKSAD